MRYLIPALLVLCACGSELSPKVIHDARDALDQTQAPITGIAEEATALGYTLDAACTPPTPEAAAAATLAPVPPGAASLLPAAEPAPPLLPPAACSKALPAVDAISKRLDELQRFLDRVDLAIAVAETIVGPPK